MNLGAGGFETRPYGWTRVDGPVSCDGVLTRRNDGTGTGVPGFGASGGEEAEADG